MLASTSQGICSAVLFLTASVFWLSCSPINRNSDDSTATNGATERATPWSDGSCRYRSLEEAQQNVAFTIVYPQPTPDGFVLDGVLADPWYESPEDCASAKTITIYYFPIEQAGDRVTNTVQILQGTIMDHRIDPNGPDTIEIDGVYVDTKTNQNLEGTIIQSYSWITDEVGVTVIAALEQGISEADLLAFVTAMLQG